MVNEWVRRHLVVIPEPTKKSKKQENKCKDSRHKKFKKYLIVANHFSAAMRVVSSKAFLSQFSVFYYQYGQEW